jgi:hypothetical protein
MIVIPLSAGATDGEPEIPADGLLPAVWLAQMQAQTGQDDSIPCGQQTDALWDAYLEVAAMIKEWIEAKTGPLNSLENRNFLCAVYYRARHTLCSEMRGYDSTRDGHNRADKVEETAGGWLAKSDRAVARLRSGTAWTVALL